MDPKEINNTSFCNKTVDNIVSNDLKRYIIDDMRNRTKITPTSRYAKIFNHNYSKNLNNPHIFCLKTFGSPYLLFLTRINGIDYSLLIDKKVNKGHEYPKMFVVQYRFEKELYNGSLFECELLRDDDNCWKLLIADIYYYCGKIMNDTVITDRINTIHTVLTDRYIDDTFCNICEMEVKRYFDIVDYEECISEFISKLNYKIRGIYFVPINIKYSKILYMFRDDELRVNFKKTESHLNFKITKTAKPEIYELFLNDHDTLQKICIAHIKNIEMSRYINDLFSSDSDIIVECIYNKNFKKWEPLKQTDKRIHHVNDLRIIEE